MDFLRTLREAETLGLSKDEYLDIWKTECRLKLLMHTNQKETQEDVETENHSRRCTGTKDESRLASTHDKQQKEQSESDLQSRFQDNVKQLREEQKQHWEQMKLMYEQTTTEFRSRFEILSNLVTNVDSLKRHFMRELDDKQQKEQSESDLQSSIQDNVKQLQEEQKLHWEQMKLMYEQTTTEFKSRFESLNNLVSKVVETNVDNLKRHFVRERDDKQQKEQSESDIQSGFQDNVKQLQEEQKQHWEQMKMMCEQMKLMYEQTTAEVRSRFETISNLVSSVVETNVDNLKRHFVRELDDRQGQEQSESDHQSRFQDNVNQLREEQKHHWEQMTVMNEQTTTEFRSRFEILSNLVSNVVYTNVDNLKLHFMRELDLLKQDLDRMVNDACTDKTQGQQPSKMIQDTYTDKTQGQQLGRMVNDAYTDKTLGQQLDRRMNDAYTDKIQGQQLGRMENDAYTDKTQGQQLDRRMNDEYTDKTQGQDLSKLIQDTCTDKTQRQQLGTMMTDTCKEKTQGQQLSRVTEDTCTQSREMPGVLTQQAGLGSDQDSTLPHTVLDNPFSAITSVAMKTDTSDRKADIELRNSEVWPTLPSQKNDVCNAPFNGHIELQQDPALHVTRNKEVFGNEKSVTEIYRDVKSHSSNMTISTSTAQVAANVSGEIKQPNSKPVNTLKLSAYSTELSSTALTESVASNLENTSNQLGPHRQTLDESPVSSEDGSDNTESIQNSNGSDNIQSNESDLLLSSDRSQQVFVKNVEDPFCPFLSPFLYTSNKPCKARVQVHFEVSGTLTAHVHVSKGSYDDSYEWPLILSGNGYIYHPSSKRYTKIWQLQSLTCQKPGSSQTDEIVFPCVVCLATSRRKFRNVTFQKLVEGQYIENNTMTFKWTLGAKETNKPPICSVEKAITSTNSQDVGLRVNPHRPMLELLPIREHKIRYRQPFNHIEWPAPTFWEQIPRRGNIL